MILSSQGTRNTLQSSRAGAEQIITESVDKQTQRRQLNPACSLFVCQAEFNTILFLFSSTHDPSYSLLNFCLQCEAYGDGGKREVWPYFREYALRIEVLTQKDPQSEKPSPIKSELLQRRTWKPVIPSCSQGLNHGSRATLA